MCIIVKRAVALKYGHLAWVLSGSHKGMIGVLGKRDRGKGFQMTTLHWHVAASRRGIGGRLRPAHLSWSACHLKAVAIPPSFTSDILFITRSSVASNQPVVYGDYNPSSLNSLTHCNHRLLRLRRRLGNNHLRCRLARPLMRLISRVLPPGLLQLALHRSL